MSHAPSTKTPASPDRETTPAQANRRLGVTHCTACGQPIEVVGALSQNGTCNYCNHDMAAQTVLTDELRRFIQPWLTACKERDISPEMIASAWDDLDIAFDDFATTQ